MSLRRKKPFLFLIAIIFSFSMLAVSAYPVLAALGHNRAEKQSFSSLTRKFMKITNKFSRLLVKPKGTARVNLKAITVALEKDSSETTSAVFKPTPTPPIPATAARMNVSGSGPFAAEVPDAGRKDFAANQAVAVGYAGGTYYLLQDGQTVATSKKPIKVVPSGGTILNLPDFKDPNWNNTANLNSFRGNLEFAYSSQSKQLWAVNEIGVEDYLHGIAEAAEDAPEEHLKVMAIVSRSYVVHHLAGGGRHPGEPYQLKNSRNGNGDDQVYRGYTAETRQPRIAKAVGDTAGTVVTYQGEPVITPYSTCPGGRTRSPAEAGWKVNWPWCQAMDDPDTAGMAQNGHGVGLSGIGSRKRAERGEAAAQILGYYFQGSGLGQADTSGKIVRVAIYGVAAN